MRTMYMGLATAAMVVLGIAGVAQAADRTATTERTTVEHGYDELPLGLLLDDDGQLHWSPFDEEIIIKDGYVYT